MALLLTAIGESVEAWCTAFAAAMPDAEIRVWPDVGDLESIEIAVVGKIPAGELSRLPQLRLIASLFAGQDILLADQTLPIHVPIVRTDNPEGDAMMSEFALMHVLRHHRNLPAYARAQASRHWERLPQPRAEERRVGIMGLGPIGLGVARTLRSAGFLVSGWTRRPRVVNGLRLFHGVEQFKPFLVCSEILVNLLPLTALTPDILDARAFAALPEGSAIINLGRGEHLVDSDLLEAIASGHIAAATLDVFRTEPLPADHPFWSNACITITPHAARRLDVNGIARHVAENWKRLNMGEPLINVVDRIAGY